MNVFIIASLTADGFIAKNAHQSSLKWTSKEDTKFFVERTKQARVMVMGANTFATINKPLPERLIMVYTNHPEKFADFDPAQVRATLLEPAELIQQLSAEGYTELAIAGGTTIYTRFMEAGVVDELYLTIEPIIFGSGMRLFNAELEQELQLKKILDLSDQTKVFQYQVVK